jgi:subtilisin family serine protease
LAVALPALTLGLWKNFTDNFNVEIIAPNGVTTGVLDYKTAPLLAHLDGALLRVAAVQPNPYTQNCGVSFSLNVKEGNGSLSQGIWVIKVTGDAVVDVRFDIWLPTLEEVTEKAAFLTPSPDNTLTIPSCADKVITVSGCDPATGAFAAFSGRGYTREYVYVKPDISAPAVNIRSCDIFGGYGQFTGTSFAAPFVTGSIALMMQWGIMQGNDPFLYGQRVKAFLTKTARRSTEEIYPNNRWGYGILCIKDMLALLSDYKNV